MDRYFWAKFPGDDNLTVVCKTEEGNLYWFTWDDALHPNAVTLGSEIHPSKTGLLSALNDVK